MAQFVLLLMATMRMHFIGKWIGGLSLVVGLGLAANLALACGDHGVEAVSSPQKKTHQSKIVITVDERGYKPSSIEVVADKETTLVFKRVSDKGCGSEVVFPKRKIRRTLPLNKEVTVKITPKKAEKISFTCGMGMYRGSIVALAR